MYLSLCTSVIIILLSVVSAIQAASWNVWLVQPGPYSPLTIVDASFSHEGVSVRFAAFGYFEDTDNDNNYGSAEDHFEPEMEHMIVLVENMGVYMTTQEYNPTAPDPDTPWRLSPGLPFFERHDHAVVVMADGSSTGYAQRETQTPCVQIIAGP